MKKELRTVLVFILFFSALAEAKPKAKPEAKPNPQRYGGWPADAWLNGNYSDLLHCRNKIVIRTYTIHETHF